MKPALPNRFLFHLGLLAAGTTLSVGAALGCAVFSDLESETGTAVRLTTYQWFAEHAPADFRLEDRALFQARGFGVELAEIFDAPCFEDLTSYGHRLRCGWPLLSFESSFWAPLSMRARLEPRRAAELFPRHLSTLRPIWPAFLANAVLFSGVLFLSATAIAHVRNCVRAMQGRCPSCGYPRGLSSVCTECGALQSGVRVA